MDATPPIPADLISAAEAAALAPSPRPGQRTAVSTIHRWCDRGRLTAYRRGRWLFVSRAEVLGLVEAGEPAAPKVKGPAKKAEARRRSRLTAEVLQRAGLL